MKHPPVVVHAHWVVLARDLAIVASIFVAPLVVVPLMSPSLYSGNGLLSLLAPAFTALWALVAWMALAVVWTEYYLDMIIVTDRHVTVIDQLHLFNREVRQWNIDAIQDVTVRSEGVFSAWLDYGSVWISASNDESYEQLGAFAIAHPSDISALILERSRASGELEEANKRQEELLHSISHEVKGHLARSAATFASIVEGDFGAVTEHLKSAAGSALADTRTGVETVAGILDSSNLKKGTMSVVRSRFDLHAAVAKVVDELQPDAQKKGLVLRYDTGLPVCTINGDEQKLMRHVVRNLIDNAIRYTQSGTIDVTLGADDTRVLLTVSDTGVGMDAGDFSNLFTEGGKGRDSTAINPHSTGYGLFVAKTVVEAHGGTIWAESDGKGKGSRFFVELPLMLCYDSFL